MKDKDLTDEEILKTLRMTVAGTGKYGKNKSIKYYFEELTTEHYYTEEELFNKLVKYIVSKNIVRKQNVKLGTFYAVVVFNYYSNLVDKERNKQKRVKAVSNFGKARIYGQFNDHIIDNYTDNVTPESELIEKQFIEIIHQFFSPDEVECLLKLTTRKKGAIEVGNEYKYYCNRLNRKIVKIRNYLKQQGYEKEDFINIEKKRRLFLPSTHYG